ncbi:MAG TPA: hypothetical protein VKB52_16450 [Rhodanobacteraceae bacterium]|nr:hypothetical protein [Rhodanobacteraceae bacterium]
MRFDAGPPISLQEETARFLPGIYYFQKGLDYYKKGQSQAAVDAWLVSAGWAMKDAQYNLGLAYFKGGGVAADRPRGLAWLALAAERKDPTFQGSLATAWDGASEAEHQQANALWRELKKQYGDEAALPRARKRFDTEVGQLSGSHVGSSSAKVMSRTMGLMDSASYREKLEELAQQNFGKSSANAAGTPESTATDPGKDAG